MDEMHCSNLFIHHPDEFVQNYMQPIDKIILMNQDRNTLPLRTTLHKEW
jgi:hypothetical protein